MVVTSPEGSNPDCERQGCGAESQLQPSGKSAPARLETGEIGPLIIQRKAWAVDYASEEWRERE